MLAILFIPKERSWLSPLLAAIGLVITLGFSLAQTGKTSTAFGGMVVVDGFASFLFVLILSSGLAGIAVAFDYLKRMGIDRGEYYVLLLFSISGVMLMATASDLIIVFLALELLSIPLYVLAGFAQPRIESEESSLKYFLLGSFATGFLVYGIALIYGATGSTGLAEIVKAVNSGSARHHPAGGWSGVGAGWVGVQSGGSAFSNVDAGCVPGCSDRGDCLYGCRRQGRRLCSVVAGVHVGFPVPDS